MGTPMNDMIAKNFETSEWKDDADIEIKPPVVIETGCEILTFDESKRLLTGLVKVGVLALEESLTVASETRNPRAFEVAFKGMRELVETIKDLTEPERQKEKTVVVAEPPKPEQETISITAAQLLELMKSNK